MEPRTPSTGLPDADWLGCCRRSADGVRAALAAAPNTVERAVGTGRGEGGDIALVIDRSAEDAVFRELEALGVGVTTISEERGHGSLNGGGPVHVVVDPIDGSLNAKRRLAPFCVSIAVASGPTMGDVELGYVCDLARGEEWWAWRGGGAFVDGERMGALRPGGRLEMLGIEVARPERVRAAASLLGELGAERLRAIGSIALSMCFVADARLDAMVSLGPSRSVDAAAAQLIVREAGGVVDLPEADPPGLAASLGLEMRSRVVAAADADMRQLLVARVTGPLGEGTTGG